MLQLEIAAVGRNTFGKGGVRKIRRDGLTPAVMYGPNSENIALQLDTSELTTTLLAIHGKNALITLNINKDGEESKRHVMVKEIQTEPVTDSVLHTDFVELPLDKLISLEVPLRYSGKAKGVEMGGDLHVLKKSVQVKGRILDIPDSIEIDVTNLGIGESTYCRDLTITDNISILNAEDTVCVSVMAPVVSSTAAEQKVEGTKKKK